MARVDNQPSRSTKSLRTRLDYACLSEFNFLLHLLYQHFSNRLRTFGSACTIETRGRTNGPRGRKTWENLDHRTELKPMPITEYFLARYFPGLFRVLFGTGRIDTRVNKLTASWEREREKRNDIDFSTSSIDTKRPARLSYGFQCNEPSLSMPLYRYKGTSMWKSEVDR